MNNVLWRLLGAIGGAVIGFVVGIILAMKFTDGISLPPDNGNWVWIGGAMLVFGILGFVFYRAIGRIFSFFSNSSIDF